MSVRNSVLAGRAAGGGGPVGGGGGESGTVNVATGSGSNAVTVGVRIRPTNEKERTEGVAVAFSSSDDGGSVEELDEDGCAIKHWHYDHVFGPHCSNQDIFNTMGVGLVDGALEGYNVVMFMYGQTSSGKTFTLFGADTTPGCVHLAMELVYERVMASVDVEYVIKVTYAELYNEEIKDLLSATPNENLKIIDDPLVGPLIHGITEAPFTSATDVRRLLEEGERRRHFGVTNMNAHSSRSHVIVRLHIDSRKVVPGSANWTALRTSWGKDRPTCMSTLNLVDLAGSERAGKAGTSGQSLKEGSFINKSLLTLGTVISNLSEGKTQHIPYRNSKLTRLLATALGGNAKTCVITCISPASSNYGESTNTLRFASRAKRIVNQVHKNEVMDMKSLTSKLSVQIAEIESLRQQLELSRQMGFNPDDEEQGDSLRVKAAGASKNWRTLRFFMKNGARILGGLRAQGMSHLAKKVTADMRETVNGQRDPGKTLEECIQVVETYLSKDRKLLSRIQSVAMANEAESIDANSGIMDSDDEDGNDEGDIFQYIEAGSDETKEAVEAALFGKEDLRMYAVNRITQLTDELHESFVREKTLRKQLDDAQQSVFDQSEAVRQLKNVQFATQGQLEDLNHQRNNELASCREQIQQLLQRNTELEVQLGDNAQVLTTRAHDLIAKDAEIEKLKSQLEQLTNELNATHASRRTFEMDAQKVRAEMRIQMDRLRSNMHEMLAQGGEETKVIQLQNTQLQREVDSLRDELETIGRHKEQLQQEVSQQRSQIQIQQEEWRSQQEELSILREENEDHVHKLRDLRVQFARISSAHTMAEQAATESASQLALEKKNAEERIESHAAELKTLRERSSTKLADLTSELEARESELESLRAQLVSRQALIQKIETSSTAELLRLEKKLNTQTRYVEQLQEELASTKQEICVQQDESQKEISRLQMQLAEQTSTIDMINQYVDRQRSELSIPVLSLGDDDLSLAESAYASGVDDYSLSSPRDNQFGSPLLGGNSTHNSLETWNKNESRISANGELLFTNTGLPMNAMLVSEPSRDIVDQLRWDSTHYCAGLVSSFLEALLHEDNSLRDAMINYLQEISRETTQRMMTMETLQQREEFLDECRIQLSQTLQFSEQKVDSLMKQLQERDAEHANIQRDYHRVHKAEQLAVADRDRLSQQHQDLRLTCERLRTELQQAHTEAEKARMAFMRESARVEEVRNEVSTLQAHIDLLSREKRMLMDEREQFFSRYTSVLPSPPATTSSSATAKPTPFSPGQTQSSYLSSFSSPSSPRPVNVPENARSPRNVPVVNLRSPASSKFDLGTSTSSYPAPLTMASLSDSVSSPIMGSLRNSLSDNVPTRTSWDSTPSAASAVLARNSSDLYSGPMSRYSSSLDY